MRGHTNVSLRYQATRADKAKHNWKLKNEKSMFEYRKIKYLLLALMTIYVPVTRNSPNGLLRPKYAYAQYKCTPGAGSDDPTTYIYVDESTTSWISSANPCAASASGNNQTAVKVQSQTFPQGCYTGSHLAFVGLSVLVLLLFTLAFPVMISKVIKSMKPAPAFEADDPEHPYAKAPSEEDGDYKKQYDALHGKRVIYDDNGILVEYTNKIFLAEVRKHRHNPYASLYTGFEMEWANYKAIVMGMKFLQLLPTVLLTSKTVSKALNGDDINKQEECGRGSRCRIGRSRHAIVRWTCFKASPYVDPINDKMDHVSRCALHYTLHRSRQQIHAHYHGLCVGDCTQPLCCRLRRILNHDDHLCDGMLPNKDERVHR